MRYLKALYLIVGLVLLGFVAAQIDVPMTISMVSRVGWGMLAIMGIYLVAFVVDSLSWQIALPDVPLDSEWAYRMWKVRMVGEAFNSLLPAGGMGGEPIKAVLMNKHYGVGYTDVTTSLLLTKTINMISLVLFLAGGFSLMAGSALPSSYKTISATGLGVFALSIVLFFIIQRMRIASHTGQWLSKTRVGRKVGTILHHIHAMDDRLVEFYTRRRGRFLAATLLGLLNWMLGILEIYYAALFLGHPITMTDAWIVEAALQLVRTGAFFIPAGIGAQEGLLVLIFTAMTGVPTLGAAVAIVRRLREIVWIGWGLLLGSRFPRTPVLTDAPSP